MPRRQRGSIRNLGKRESLKAWAQRNKVSLEVAQAYQKARRTWMNRVTDYARRRGTPVSKDIPAHVQDIQRIPGMDLEEYLEFRTSVIRERASHATEWLDARVDTYLMNLLGQMQDSPQFEGTNIPELFYSWLFGTVDENGKYTRAPASRFEKSRMVSAMGGASLSILGYVEVTDADGTKHREVSLDYDFQPVLDAFELMGIWSPGEG